MPVQETANKLVEALLEKEKMEIAAKQKSKEIWL